MAETDKAIVDTQAWRKEIDSTIRDLVLCTGGHYREGLSSLTGKPYRTALSCSIARADKKCPACAAAEFVLPAVTRLEAMKTALAEKVSEVVGVPSIRQPLPEKGP